MPLFEIEEFNVLIGNKSFFDQPVRNKRETSEIYGNDDYAAGNLL